MHDGTSEGQSDSDLDAKSETVFVSQGMPAVLGLGETAVRFNLVLNATGSVTFNIQVPNGVHVEKKFSNIDPPNT